MTTIEGVIDALRSAIGVPWSPQGIDLGYSAENRLVDDLGVDSIDAIDITMELEEKFGIDLQGRTSGWATVADIVKTVDEVLADA